MLNASTIYVNISGFQINRFNVKSRMPCWRSGTKELWCTNMCTNVFVKMTNRKSLFRSDLIIVKYLSNIFFLDVNECVSSPCNDSFSKCVNIPGSFWCVCEHDGTAGEQVTCKGRYGHYIQCKLYYIKVKL